MVQQSIVWYKIVSYSILYYTIVQYSTVYYSISQCNMVQYSILWYSIVQYSIVQYSIVQYSIVQYSIVQYSIKQHIIAQYSIVQCSDLYCTTPHTLLLLPFHAISTHLIRKQIKITCLFIMHIKKYIKEQTPVHIQQTCIYNTTEFLIHLRYTHTYIQKLALL